MQSSRSHGLLAAPHSRNGGAVILIVLTLLATLAFLGFFFYAWTDQEQISARSWASTDDSTINIGSINDHALEQLLVGTRYGSENSALWGGTQSILSHIVGPINPNLQPTVDHPFGGPGITIKQDTASNQVVIDYNGDGITDRVAYNFTTGPIRYTAAGGMTLNFSRVAQPTDSYTTDAFSLSAGAIPFFNPAAGYTYPDLNSLFLAYDSVVNVDLNNDNATHPVHIVIPSFFRPQLALDRRGASGTAGAVGGLYDNGPAAFQDVFTNQNTVDQSLRPHMLHAVGVDGSGNPIPRFLSASSTQAQSGNTNRFIPPFTFAIDRNGNGVGNEMGVLSNASNEVDANNYELDVDTDGDGVNDAIWMDLGLQMIDLPDGRQVVPLVAVKIIDFDALFNINLHGNLAGLGDQDSFSMSNLLVDWNGDGTFDPSEDIDGDGILDGPETDPGGLGVINEDTNDNGILDAGEDINNNTTLDITDYNRNGILDAGEDLNGNGLLDAGDIQAPLHRSNMGLSPSEINIGWGLFANPATLSTGSWMKSLLQYPLPMTQLDMSGTPTGPLTTPLGMATADLFGILAGRPLSLGGGVAPGRHGEGTLLQSYLANFGGATGVPSPPRSGRTGIDDDKDDLTSGGLRSQTSDSTFNYLPIPPAVHPLDFTGAGRDHLFVAPGGKGAQRLLGAPYANNPSTWLQYDIPGVGSGRSRWQNNGQAQSYVNPWTAAATTGTPTLRLQIPGGIHLRDEDDEITANAWYPDPADMVFAPSENAGLQLSDADFALSGEASRLRELAPFNLNDAPLASEDFNNNGTLDTGEDLNGNGVLDIYDDTQARMQRKRFTTDSWDRLEFSTNVVPNEVDYDGDGTVDPNEDRNGNGSFDIYPRGWEFNVWGGTFGTLDQYFPPAFPDPDGTTPPVGSSIPFDYANAATSTDPIRWELRRLLRTRVINDGSNPTNWDANRLFPKLKLNINQLLVGFDANGNPTYRPLTPHPVFEPGEMDTGTGSRDMYHGQHGLDANGQPDPYYPGDATAQVPVTPLRRSFSAIGGDKFSQEWWARYDRQRMARDIYTLLWVLSGGDDFHDYTRTPLTGSITDDGGTTGRENDYFDVTTPEGKSRVREMAQFAVNLVDSLDRDDVITRFEYDEDLTNGWNVSGALPAVYGIESAQLTFSEILTIRTPPSTMQSHDNRIEYEDDNEHYHLFIELRNASPFSVAVANDQWRIRRLRGALGVHRSVTLRDTIVTDGVNPGFIGPGDLYLIASQDGENTFGGTQYRSSDFRVDWDGDGTYNAIVPNLPDPAPPTNSTTYASYPAPLCDLDLFAPSHAGRFLANGTAGSPFTSADSLINRFDRVGENTADPLIFVLERRMHLHDYGAIGVDNRWVEVDRFSVAQPQVFNIANATMTTTTEQLLQPLESTERREPFDPIERLYDTVAFPAASPPQMHTLPQLRPGAGQPERNSRFTNPPGVIPPRTIGDPFLIWQPHFDRDFSSVMELLSIPLYGYEDETMAVDAANDAVRLFAFGGPTKNVAEVDGENLRPSGHRVAGVRVLYPEPTLPSPALDGAARNPDDSVAFEHFRNRWYRLLEYLEVPSRAEESVASKLRWVRRTPGKINLNTLRDEAVMAGVIDDPTHINPVNPPVNPFAMPNVPMMTSDVVESNLGGARNWFMEMRALRDGADPFLQALSVSQSLPIAVNLPIPGSLKSRPFRSFNYVASNPLNTEAGADVRDRSILNSLLRPRMIGTNPALPPLDPDAIPDPADPPPDIPNHGLFEARSQADRTGASTPADTVDYHTRNRILAKVDNLTTNRSHVFGIWMTVGFFESHRLATGGGAGQVQIGGRAEDLPLRRLFVVADMSRIEEAYEDSNPADGVQGYFDFRKFIIYRKQLK